MEKRNKHKRMAIWALDPELNLADIPALLALNYNKIIPYLEQMELRVFDKTLMNRWEKYYENDDGFILYEMQIMNTSISYIAALAVFETPAPVRDAVHEVEGRQIVIRKEDRVTQYTEPVFFLDISGRVYVVVIGSSYNDGKIRSSLMGGGRRADPGHKGWGRIQTAGIENFTFNSDFFYWLVNKGNSVLETLFGDVEIGDIQNISQSSERGDTSHTSEGANVLDEALPKTGLGIRQNIEHLGTTITVTSEGNFKIILYEDGECHVDIFNSAVNGEHGELEPITENYDITASFIYGVMLPAFKAKYHAEINSGEWTTQHVTDAKRAYALEVINELCIENRISIDELRTLDVFQ